MKKTQYLFVFFLFFAYLPAYADTCDLLDKISAEINSAKKNAISTWNVSKLKQKLGPPTSTKVLGSDQMYEWKTFISYTNVNGGGSGVGYFQGYNHFTAMDEAKKVLGKPLVKVIDPLTQYEWRCSPKSWLKVSAYDSQDLKTASGQICSQSQCVPFSVTFNISSQAEKTYQKELKLHEKEISRNGFQIFAKQYNDYFHVAITNYKELYKDMENRKNQYYAKLGKCETGEYSYATQPPGSDRIVIRQSTVQKEAEQCLIKTIEIGENSPVICKFPLDQITVFTGLATPSNRGLFSDAETKVDQLMRTYCQFP